MYNKNMYIFELIVKLAKKEKTTKKSTEKDIDYDEKCSHSFLPIDSTGDILACSKCGLIKKREDLKIKPKNPFSE